MVALSYYGFNFGWKRLVPDLYLGYVLAGAGEAAGYLGVMPVVQAAGRRRATFSMFCAAAVFYLVGIPDVQLGAGDWTLQSAASLVCVVFVNAAFSLVFLYSGELAPSSHRGLVLCLASSAARLGGFLGPFIFNNLFLVFPQALPWGLRAGLGAACAGACCLLVETGGRSVPATPTDVTQRRKRYFTYKLT